MKLDEGRLEMIINSMGRAVIELSFADSEITQQAIVDKLEGYRKDAGNVIGKDVNRDAAEIVRKGSKAVE